MDLLYSIMLDKNSPLPLYQQLAESILVLIEEGKLSPGDKLPPIRKLAKHISVNNITVVNAYKHLESKKILRSYIGRGTFVSDTPDFKKSKYGALIDYDFDLKNAINFAKSNVSTEFFPVNAFKDAFNKILERDCGNAFLYHESKGHLPLITEICKDLQRYNINASEEDIQIISGIRLGVNIVAKALLSEGDTVIVEQPSYYAAMGALYPHKVILNPVEILEDGMDLNKLEAQLKISRPKLICITSYFQTPTCYSYSLEKKKSLLKLAQKYNLYIMEEDSLSEFNYSDKKIVPLKALDDDDRVILIKSYSGRTMQGLNISALIAPQNVMSRISPPIDRDIGAVGFIQRAFALFLSSGEYYTHMEHMREVMKERYLAAINAAAAYLTPYAAYTISPLGGLNIWLKLKSENISIDVLSQRLLAENIIIIPGILYDMKNEDIPYFMLCFAGVKTKDIEFGIKKIAKCIQEME